MSVAGVGHCLPIVASRIVYIWMSEWGAYHDVKKQRRKLTSPRLLRSVN